MPEKFINYSLVGGYSPNDGLGEGQWVPRPGNPSVHDWVGELKSAPVIVANRCVTCEAEIGVTSTRCRSCAGRIRRAAEKAAKG